MKNKTFILTLTFFSKQGYYFAKPKVFNCTADAGPGSEFTSQTNYANSLIDMFYEQCLEDENFDGCDEVYNMYTIIDNDDGSFCVGYAPLE